MGLAEAKWKGGEGRRGEQREHWEEGGSGVDGGQGGEGKGKWEVGKSLELPYLVTDVAAHWDGHEDELGVETCPEDTAEFARLGGEGGGHLWEEGHLVGWRVHGRSGEFGHGC